MSGPTLPNIPAEVWQSRALLKELRDRAHSRAAGADVVLHSFLVSVAAAIPAHVSIDTGIGAPVRPSLFAVLAGPPGVGKSTGWAVARSLLPGGYAEPLAPSTGQGIVEAFYDHVLVEQQQPDGSVKVVKARRRTRGNRLFHLDEGEALYKALEQAGGVLGETLRSAWSGATVGQANADVMTRRTLAAGTYTLGLVIGLQPDIAGRLLADTGTGMAQRFLWSSVRDPGIPKRGRRDAPPALLGPLSWAPPRLVVKATLEDWAAQPPVEGAIWREPEPVAPVTITIDPVIRDDIWDTQVALRRGDVEPDEHDTQHTAMRVKVGAVLGWLDGRLDIGREDWEIAGALLDASAAVRDALIEHAESVTARGRAEKGIERAAINRAQTEAEVFRDRCELRVTDVLMAAIETDGKAHHELKKAVTAQQRPHLAEVLADLIERGAVIVTPSAQGGRRYRIAIGKATTEGDRR